MSQDTVQSTQFNLTGTLNSLSIDFQNFRTDFTGRGANTQQSLEFGISLLSYLPTEQHPR